MSKKFLEVSLSIFLIVCSVCLIIGIYSVKSLLDSQCQLVEATQQNQEEVVKAANDFKKIITEVGYSAAVIAMSENRMIQPAKADKLLDKSINTIKEKSTRFGELAQYFNEYRINHSRKR